MSVLLYRHNSLLMGMMSCGMTGRTLLDPALSMSYTPCSARNAYGISSSRRPSKKIGR